MRSTRASACTTFPTVTIEPFRALFFAARGPELGRRLLLRAPADVDRRELARREPLHALFLLGANDPDWALSRWRDKGALIEKEAPAFYVLESHPSPGSPPARFLICALGPDSGAVELEETGPRPVRAPLEPIPALAPDDGEALSGLLVEATADHAPELETQAGSLALRLWSLPPGRLARRIARTLKGARVRPLGPLPEGGRCLAAIVSLSDPGIAIRPVHRGITGVQTFRADRFLTLVGGYARISELPAPLSTASGIELARSRLASAGAEHHAVLLVLPGGEGRILRFRQRLSEAQIRAAPKDPTLRSFDLALLNTTVLRTVLGLDAPEAPGHPQVVPVDSLEELVEKVRSGELQAGFGLNPPPRWELRAVMEAGARLPPRSLRLEPLPPAGLLFMAPLAEG
ncbi:MAG: DUF1015 family protein [Myxococcales bacterium]|nr:DUF1015 family protein [Myxococcales bacterium]